MSCVGAIKYMEYMQIYVIKMLEAGGIPVAWSSGPKNGAPMRARFESLQRLSSYYNPNSR